MVSADPKKADFAEKEFEFYLGEAAAMLTGAPRPERPVSEGPPPRGGTGV
jgi:hypothetical protein